MLQIKSIFNIMQENAKKFVDYIGRESSGGKCIETKDLCAKYTTENVVNCSFGIEAKCFQNLNSEFREMGRKITQPSLIMGVKHLILMIMPSLACVLSVKYIENFNIKPFYLKHIFIKTDYSQTMWPITLGI